MVENLDNRLGIFGARFPYFECHFRRPFAVLIKEYATGPREAAHSLQKPSRFKSVQNISQRDICGRPVFGLSGFCECRPHVRLKPDAERFRFLGSLDDGFRFFHEAFH